MAWWTDENALKTTPFRNRRSSLRWLLDETSLRWKIAGARKDSCRAWKYRSSTRHEGVYRNALHARQSMTSTPLDVCVNESRKFNRGDWEKFLNANTYFTNYKIHNFIEVHITLLYIKKSRNIQIINSQDDQIMSQIQNRKFDQINILRIFSYLINANYF